MRRLPDVPNSGKLNWTGLNRSRFIELTRVLGSCNCHVPRLENAAAAVSAAKPGTSVCRELKEGFGPRLAWLDDVLITLFIRFIQVDVHYPAIAHVETPSPNIYHVGAVALRESVSHSATFSMYLFNRVDAALCNALIWLVDGVILQVDAEVWVQLRRDLRLAATAAPVGCGPSLWTIANVTRNAASAWKSDFWKNDKRKGKGFTGNLQIPPLASSGYITDFSLKTPPSLN